MGLTCVRSRIALALAMVAMGATVAGCNRSGPVVAHESLTSLEPLRRAFNADSGKVRAIFLASPT